MGGLRLLHLTLMNYLRCLAHLHPDKRCLGSLEGHLTQESYQPGSSGAATLRCAASVRSLISRPLAASVCRVVDGITPLFTCFLRRHKAANLPCTLRRDRALWQLGKMTPTGGVKIGMKMSCSLP